MMKSPFGFFTTLVAILALAPFPAGAQDAVALPELHSKRLLNTLQVIVASPANQGEDMTIGWILRYGSAFDPANKGGLAYVTSQMLGKATMDQTAASIQAELDHLNAELEVSCDWDRMSILLRVTSAMFERALLLLYQIVGEAEFLEADLDRIKADRIRQLESPEDPGVRIRSSFEQELFAGTTYGRPLRGTKSSLENITLGDVRHFYQRYFSSGEAALVIVGSAPPDLALAKVSRIWGIWVRKDSIPFTFLPPRPPSSRTVVLDDDPQSPAAQFVLGSLCPQRNETSYWPVRLAADILQERLTAALPTSLLTVGLDGRRMPGAFFIQGQAAADQMMEQAQKIVETVDALKATGCSSEELQSAQSRWVDEFHRSLRTTDGICRALLDAEVYRLGTNYLAMFNDMVRRSDLDAVKQAAKDWILPGGIMAAVRGPAATLKEPLASWGTLREPR